jgi:hypothetical protein
MYKHMSYFSQLKLNPVFLIEDNEEKAEVHEFSVNG